MNIIRQDISPLFYPANPVYPVITILQTRSV